MTPADEMRVIDWIRRGKEIERTKRQGPWMYGWRMDYFKDRKKK